MPEPILNWFDFIPHAEMRYIRCFFIYCYICVQLKITDVELTTLQKNHRSKCKTCCYLFLLTTRHRQGRSHKLLLAGSKGQKKIVARGQFFFSLKMGGGGTRSILLISGNFLSHC